MDSCVGATWDRPDLRESAPHRGRDIRTVRRRPRARVPLGHALLAEFPGAQFVVRVRAARIFPNCPRYIHRMSVVEPSQYVPRPDATPPVPKWKRFDAFRDVLASDDPARRSDE
jgi:uncharacterized protein